MRLDKSRKLLLALGLGFFLKTLAMPVGAYAASSDLIHLQTYKSYSRMTLEIDGSIPCEWKKSKQGFEIFFPGFSLLDLGVSTEEVSTLKHSLTRLKDSRVKNIKIDESPKGVKITGDWRFPSGRFALANPVMDTFDFREKTPPHYIVDFWIRPGLKLSDYRALKQKEKLDVALKRMQNEEKLSANREIAMEGRKAEVHDLDRYCTQPLSSQDDFFLRFYPVHKSIDLSKWFPSTSPDANFDYFIPEGKSREAQYVRLAKKLYDGGNFALAIRSLGFFEGEYPKSPLLVEMKFLKANALIKLGHNPSGEHILDRLVRDHKSSPVALYSAMYLALKHFQKKSTAIALEKLLWLIDNHSDHQLNWVFHLAAAECMFELAQSERAIKEYRWLMEKGPSPEQGAEGAFRLGDAYLRRFQYEKALGYYYQGIQKFEKFGGKFPEYYLNRGESLYQLGELERAKEEFNQFLARFPSHPEGWRATFRIAEIAGRDPKSSGPTTPEFREKLYDTINHYPSSPGAILARIRLASCGDHGDFDIASQEKFFVKDAMNFDGAGSVVMTDYPDFRAITHLRSLISSGTPQKTLELALNEFKLTRSPLVKRLLRTAAYASFQKLIVGLLKEGKGYEALSLYSAKAPVLPVAQEEVDRDYLLRLSEVASDLQMGKLAQDLLKEYKKLSGLKREIANATPQSKRSVAEQDFALAKALWIKIKNAADTTQIKPEENLNRVKQLLELSKGDPRFELERELILGQIAESEGRLDQAIQHVAQARLIHDGIRLEAWLASLYLKANHSEVALSLYESVEKKHLKIGENRDEKDLSLISLGLPAAPDLNQVILKQAQILESNEKWSEAFSAFDRLVARGQKTNRILFGYARSLEKSKKEENHKKILETLNEIVKTEPQDPEEKFWKNLAVQTLATEKIHETIQKNAKEGTL